MEKSVFVDLTLISSSGMEFIIEIIMKFFYPSKYQQKYIIEILSIFELFKFFLRCKKIEMNPFRKIFISERSYFSENLATATQCSNEFDDLYKFEYTGLVEKTEDTFTLTKKECQHKILSSIKNMRNYIPEPKRLWNRLPPCQFQRRCSWKTKIQKRKIWKFGWGRWFMCSDQSFIVIPSFCLNTHHLNRILYQWHLMFWGWFCRKT